MKNKNKNEGLTRMLALIKNVKKDLSKEAPVMRSPDDSLIWDENWAAILAVEKFFKTKKPELRDHRTEGVYLTYGELLQLMYSILDFYKKNCEKK